MKRLWSVMKSGVRKLRRLFNRRKIQQAAAFAVSLGICSYILWYLLPVWLAAFIISVVVFHEFGHYFVAKYQHKRVKLPLFFPGIYLMAGCTAVDEGGRKDPTIALTGPLVGMITAAMLGVGSLILGFMPGVWASCWLFVFQLYSGTFGSDGKAYQKARRDAAPSVVLPWTGVVPALAG